MSSIDLSTIPQNVPSICIPRIFPSITEKQIQYVFGVIYLGVIRKIDIIPMLNKKGEIFNCVYIHFHRWNNTVTATNTRITILEGKHVKIMYDDPWFWKIYAHKHTIHKRRTVPYIIQETEIECDYCLYESEDGEIPEPPRCTCKKNTHN